MTKLIDTPKCLLVGNLPKGAEKFETSIQDDWIPCLTYWHKDNFDPTVICLPPGSYGQPILASEMGWELKREIVEDDEGWYPDFVNEGMTYLTSHDSFDSLLSSHNLQPSTTVVIPKTLTHA